jgi:glycerol uptake facilitator-like aquaporin
MQRYLAEFLGTFILILAGCGAIAVNSLTGDPQFIGIGSSGG